MKYAGDKMQRIIVLSFAVLFALAFGFLAPDYISASMVGVPESCTTFIHRGKSRWRRDE